MKNPFRSLLFALALLALFASQSFAGTTITFDDINTNGGCCTPIPNGYNGLNWNNFFALDATASPYSMEGYGAGLVSPPNVAFNGGGSPASITSGANFTLTSGYFTGAWNDGLNITITGLENGTPLFNETIVVNSTSPTLETFNWAGINEVDFNSFGGTPNPNYIPFGSGEQFVLDNLTINGGAPGVPEPGTLVLFGTGLLGIAGRKLNL